MTYLRKSFVIAFFNPSLIFASNTNVKNKNLLLSLTESSAKKSLQAPVSLLDGKILQVGKYSKMMKESNCQSSLFEYGSGSQMEENCLCKDSEEICGEANWISSSSQLLGNGMSKSGLSKSVECKIPQSSYDRPFKCDQCPLSYRNKESLKQHYNKHLGIEPLKCDHCDLKTYDRSVLMKHMRKHTGDRPYMCNCCGQGFKTSDTLKMHIRTHTGERPYKCEICDKMFAYKSNMRSHCKRHSDERPFKCPVCGRDFIDVTSFRIHSRRHTGEKPFVCQECKKSFTHSSGLYAHLKVHEATRPFKCGKCDKAFGRGAHLKKHFERMHKAIMN